VIQRVKNASVEVEGEITGKIEEGLMVLVGFGGNDSEKEVDYLSKKLTKLKIFPDEDGRMALSLKDTNMKLLLVPQFTLYAKNKKNKLSFHKALNPKRANELFDYFVKKCISEGVSVETGIFGAFMNVNLLNNGPVTILLEKEFD
jgi:D-tyrosyl-tRNA(Tyr) deacylase